MGNNKSNDYVVHLTETQLDELSIKTKYQREEILKLHSEFIVNILRVFL